MKKIFNNQGFTLMELLVSAAIIIVIFSFVLVNFRTGQRSGEASVAIKQIINGITTVRTMALGGQMLTNGTFPEGGYGINFDISNPSQFVLFEMPVAGGSYQSGDGIMLTNGLTQFKNIEFIQFCGTNNVTTLPCQAGWQDLKSGIDNYLEVVFVSPGVVMANYPSAPDYKYVGGIIEHQDTKKKAYFYVSLVSGLVTGDLL